MWLLAFLWNINHPCSLCFRTRQVFSFPWDYMVMPATLHPYLWNSTNCDRCQDSEDALCANSHMSVPCSSCARLSEPYTLLLDEEGCLMQTCFYMLSPHDFHTPPYVKKPFPISKQIIHPCKDWWSNFEITSAGGPVFQALEKSSVFNMSIWSKMRSWR